MDYFLKQVDPGNPYPLLISLHEDEMKIGRASITSLTRYNRVSRYHALFTKRNDSWFITDLKSLNYLYVNLERIQHTVQLNIGDIIGFGSPNVSQDGGFVCVLAARSKVVVKQEPSDDECVQIQTNSTHFVPARSASFSIEKPSTVESISRQHIPVKTDESEIPNFISNPANLRSISSVNPHICKTESTLDLLENIKVLPKVKALTLHPAIITKKEDILNCIESDTVYSTKKHKNLNPVLNARDYKNDQMQHSTAYDNLNRRETLSNAIGQNDVHNQVHSTHINKQSALISAYPGIEYLEGLEEFRSCEIATNAATSKDLGKCGDSDTSTLLNFNPVQEPLNSVTLKKEVYTEDFNTHLGENREVKTIKLQMIPGTSEKSIESINSARFENSENISDRILKKTIVNERFPKVCTQTCSIHLPNDVVKLNTNSVPIPNIPSQSLNTESFSENADNVNNFVKNILSSHETNNMPKNYKENSHSKGDLEQINDTTKACLTKQLKFHSRKQKYDRFAIYKDVNQAKTTRLKISTVNNMKTCEDKDHLSKRIRDCSIQLVKCDSNNIKMSLNGEESKSHQVCTSNKDQFDENSSDSSIVNNSLEVSSKLKNPKSQAKRNNLTVAINLKVRKNKIVSSESDCEEGSEFLFPSPKSFTTVSIANRKKEKHHKDNHASKRCKTKKAKDGEFCLSPHSEISYSPLKKERKKSDKVPIASHFARSQRLYSGSDYSDEYSRSRYSPENEKCGIPHKTKSKSLGRTLLIDSKPMEYRSRHLRGREEWFQERSSARDVENVAQTSTYKSSRWENFYAKKSNMESCEIAKSADEHPRKRKLMSCCQTRKENTKLKYSFKKSKEIHSQKLEDSSQKIEENSRKNMQIDSVVRKRAMPPVPRRTNNFCSRMGFLIDTQVKCDKKSIDKNKEREKLKKMAQNPLKHRGIMSSENNLNLNLSLELELAEDKKQTPTYETTPVKHNSTKTTTNSEVDGSAIAIQYSTSNFNEHSKLPTSKHKSEKWIPILEFDSKRKNNDQSKTCVKSMSDKVSDSNILKKTSKESYRSRDINDPTNSKKVVAVSHNHKISNETTKSRRSAKTIKYFHASSTLLMEMIVSWNPKWLVEQKNNKNPPPLIAQGSSFLNISFSSYESYASSYFPMIVLEAWECLFRECSPHLVSNHLENCNNFCYTIKTWENKRGLTELKCESVVSDVLCYHPTEGKIVLLNIKDRQERGMENYIFGCIRRHSIEVFKPGAPDWASIPADALNNAKLVKFEMIVKKSKRPTQLKSIYLAHGLSNIKQKLQLADSLRSFRNSPLCKDIYHPREETLMFCDSSRETLSSVDLVQAISEEVLNPVSKAKFILLQAPPGTGKTRCVVEIVKKLALGISTKTKILVCAPSYTALDEILCGLVQLNVNCSNSSSADLLKFVTLDEHKEMCSNLKEYSLTGKVAKLYKEDCLRKMYKRESALKLLEEKINDILFKQQTSQDMYTKINKSTTLKALVDKLEILKDKNLLHLMDEGFRKGYECIILQKSDVLLSILESNMLPAVGTFLKGVSVAYCVVDEAAQCNELQLLQCLHHEQIGKLILFGDSQQQQPTTISKCAAKCGFGRSIFERFFIHYKKKFHKIPSPALKKQYRMHSEICQFPSKYFYNQELSTAEGTDEMYAHFPLKPYTVLDVLDPGPIPDDTESSLITYICSLLTQACPAASIGIIVTEEDKKHGLSLPWDPEYSTVEMNTVEGFQGREKDIVLIPCIRQSAMLDGESLLSNGKMLNAALTRAKQCLIIFGQVASHVQYPHWRALMDDALSRNCYLCVASVTHLPLVFANYIKKV